MRKNEELKVEEYKRSNDDVRSGLEREFWLQKVQDFGPEGCASASRAESRSLMRHRVIFRCFENLDSLDNRL